MNIQGIDLMEIMRIPDSIAGTPVKGFIVVVILFICPVALLIDVAFSAEKYDRDTPGAYDFPAFIMTIAVILVAVINLSTTFVPVIVVALVMLVTMPPLWTIVWKARQRRSEPVE